MKWLELFQAFIQREGHGYVPYRHLEQGKHLGHWVSAQRMMHHKNKLPNWKAQLLNELPEWRWSTSDQKAEGLLPRRKNRVADARYPQYVALLRQFIEAHGHANVPFRYAVNGRNLGIWVRNRRKDFRLSILDDWKIKKLESISGWYW